MKNKIILFAGLLVIFCSFGYKKLQNTEEIKWYDWDTGVTKARNEGKIALIDTYTDWCYWCKVMDKNTYSNKKIIEIINKDFVPIKFNPELDKKYINGADTMSGRQLLGALSGGKHSGYPTTYFYLTKRNIMYQESGYIEVDKFENILKGMIAEHNKP
ncbi:MAG: DUF255 domain-containing protein [Bacteroidetes bacterium]|nr:DUF255 domain-containing protein [Bacteroidota bacterium]